MPSLIYLLSILGHAEHDSLGKRTQKSFLVFLITLMCASGLICGGLSFSHGFAHQSIISYAYVIISGANLIYFHYAKNISVLRLNQLVISIVILTVTYISLGNIFGFGFIVLWSFIIIIAASMMNKFHELLVLLPIFLSGTLLSIFYEQQAYLQSPATTPSPSLLFFVCYSLVFSFIVYGLIHYLVVHRNNSKKAIKNSNETANILRETLAGQYEELQKLQRKLKLMKGKLKESEQVLEKGKSKSSG